MTVRKVEPIVCFINYPFRFGEVYEIMIDKQSIIKKQSFLKAMTCRNKFADLSV